MGDGRCVLYVDDHETMGKALIRALGKNGWDVEWHDSVEAALVAMQARSYDMVLLDWRMPGLPGVDACRALRLRRPDCPIIVFTVAEGLGDRVTALDAGADDYVFKRVEIEELCARMRAVLRRSGTRQALTPRFGDIVIDLKAYRLYAGFGAILLPATTNQVRLLEPLVEAQGGGISESALVALIYKDLPSDPHNSICSLAASARRLLEPSRVRLLKDDRVYFLRDLDGACDLRKCAAFDTAAVESNGVISAVAAGISFTTVRRTGGGGVEKNNLLKFVVST